MHSASVQGVQAICKGDRAMPWDVTCSSFLRRIQPYSTLPAEQSRAQLSTATMTSREISIVSHSPIMPVVSAGHARSRASTWGTARNGRLRQWRTKERERIYLSERSAQAVSKGSRPGGKHTSHRIPEQALSCQTTA